MQGANVEKLTESMAKVFRDYTDVDKLDTGSDFTFQLASAWLEICLAEHPECASFQGTSELPSRVLDVGNLDGRSEPFLYESKKETGRYLALSHCWGAKHASHVPRTTIDTLPSRKAGIPLSTMPPTFRDAVMIARRFDIRYLWIDSLCIIQDSLSDWVTESAQMAKIFRGAFFTIGARHAPDSLGGCFSSRPTLLHHPMPVGFEDPPKAHMDRQEDGRHLFLGFSGPYPPTHIKDMEPLDTRAWVLQERILSTRTLLYGANEVLWECLIAQYSEESSDDYLDANKITLLGMVNTGPNATSEARHGRWHDVVRDYSARGLTYASDKLAAISGIASARQERIPDTYLAGLWRNWLDLDLLWYVQSNKVTRIDPAVAPSWSWASIDGPVQYLPFRPYRDIIIQPMMQVIDANVDGALHLQTGRIVLETDCKIAIASSPVHHPFDSQKSTVGSKAIKNARWNTLLDDIFDPSSWYSLLDGRRTPLQAGWLPDETPWSESSVSFLPIIRLWHLWYGDQILCLGVTPIASEEATPLFRRVGLAVWSVHSWFGRPYLGQSAFQDAVAKKRNKDARGDRPAYLPFSPDTLDVYDESAQVKRMKVGII